MYMYMIHTYIHMRMHVFLCTHTHTYSSVQRHTYPYTSIHVFTHSHVQKMRVYVACSHAHPTKSAPVCRCMYEYVHIYVNIYAHVYIYVNICTKTYIYILANTFYIHAAYAHKHIMCTHIRTHNDMCTHACVYVCSLHVQIVKVIDARTGAHM